LILKGTYSEIGLKSDFVRLVLN